MTMPLFIPCTIYLSTDKVNQDDLDTLKEDGWKVKTYESRPGVTCITIDYFYWSEA